MKDEVKAEIIKKLGSKTYAPAFIKKLEDLGFGDDIYCHEGLLKIPVRFKTNYVAICNMVDEIGVRSLVQISFDDDSSQVLIKFGLHAKAEYKMQAQADFSTSKLGQIAGCNYSGQASRVGTAMVTSMTNAKYFAPGNYFIEYIVAEVRSKLSPASAEIFRAALVKYYYSEFPRFRELESGVYKRLRDKASHKLGSILSELENELFERLCDKAWQKLDLLLQQLCTDIRKIMQSLMGLADGSSKNILSALTEWHRLLQVAFEDNRSVKSTLEVLQSIKKAIEMGIPKDSKPLLELNEIYHAYSGKGASSAHLQPQFEELIKVYEQCVAAHRGKEQKVELQESSSLAKGHLTRTGLGGFTSPMQSDGRPDETAEIIAPDADQFRLVEKSPPLNTSKFFLMF